MIENSTKSQRVLITGARGQDGTLLRRWLTQNNIPYLGISRPDASKTISDEELLNSENKVLAVDLTNINYASVIVKTFKPTHIFHLATVNASSRSRETNTWQHKIDELNQTQVVIFNNLLNILKGTGIEASTIVAGSSRMYDPQIVGSKLINEQTDTSPVDEYGHAKATCKKIATVLRESGQRVSTAILFNHESTLRKRGFLFPDLAEGISQYLQGKNSSVAVRDSNAIGDWHAAEDTIAGMWMQSNLDVSHDVLFCSSKVITVRELVGELFEKFFIGIPTPHLISTKNINTKPVIYGDNSFAKSLGWKPEKSVTHVLYEMVMHNLNSES